jgi:hypothetical protein
MTSKWISIEDQKPEEGQPVYYYFGVFDSVYDGYYKSYSDEYYPQGISSDIFYSALGFLTDDVTWWMLREELPEGVSFFPAHPTDEQKAQCKYHPYPESKEAWDNHRKKHK